MVVHWKRLGVGARVGEYRVLARQKIVEPCTPEVASDVQCWCCLQSLFFPFDSFVFFLVYWVNGEWLKVSTVLVNPNLSAKRCLKYLTRLFNDLPAWIPNLRRQFKTQFRTGSELQNRCHLAYGLDLYCPPAGVFARHDQHVLIVTNTWLESPDNLYHNSWHNRRQVERRQRCQPCPRFHA
jgi:hypothetical protein